MALPTEVLQAKEFYKETLIAIPNVVGVGTGYKVRRGQRTDELCIVVLVQEKIPEAGLEVSGLIPQEVDGIMTDVIQVGELRAFQAPTERWRPAPGGVSLGHYKVTAGTLGAVVRDEETGTRLILSNNHVLANSNDATPGDPILQPGTADGGTVEADMIARLERFYPIEFATEPADCPFATFVAKCGNALARVVGSRHRLQAHQYDRQATNLVDAAVALPVDDDVIMDEILGIGVVSGITDATLGMSVRKSGRTTGLTTGEVTVLDTTVNVSYGSNRSARFEDQILTGSMSQGGDSGSLLVASDALFAVGLLFAGSNDVTIYSPIDTVLECLKVVF